MTSTRNGRSDRITGIQSVTGQLYEQLKANIIEAGVDDAILPERKLSIRYGVSVGTVRRALGRLVADGLVYKVHGRGNFVADRKPVRRIIYADTWGDTGHPFYVRSLGAMAAEAERHALRLEIRHYGSWYRPKDIDVLIREVTDPSILGVIFPWLGKDTCDRLWSVNPRLRVVSATQPLLVPDTASVTPDWETGGAMATAYLLRSGAERLACITFNPAFEQGMRRGIDRSKDDACVTAMDATLNEEGLSELARTLKGREFDGVAFQDDRVARSVLAALTRRDPDGLKRLHTISMANTGEDILPPETAKLQIDGQVIGVTLIRLINLMDTNQFPAVNIHMPPTLVLPHFP